MFDSKLKIRARVRAKKKREEHSKIHSGFFATIPILSARWKQERSTGVHYGRGSLKSGRRRNDSIGFGIMSRCITGEWRRESGYVIGWTCWVLVIGQRPR